MQYIKITIRDLHLKSKCKNTPNANNFLQTINSYIYKLVILFLILLFNSSVYAQYPSGTGANINYEYITNVSFANLDNSSTDQDDDGDGQASYNYYDDTVAYVNTGNTYVMSVSISPDPASPNEYINVFIDWNGDGDFSDSGENIIVGSNESTTGPHITNITIPTTASTGITRMRVILSWNSAAPADGTAPNYGEVEDYNLNISKHNYIYLGDWDNNGLPNYLVSPGDYIDASTMALINNVLPESTENLDYIDHNDYLNVSLDTATNIWASFIYEGAGWKNSFAMYNYPNSSPPNSTSDIDSLTIIFPNASGNGSGLEGGGSLSAGDKVYYGHFEAGTTVAFALIARGWDNAHTNSTIDNTGNYIHYSNNNLNIESIDSLKAHNVTFWDSNQEKYILGFEDIDRESSSCDHDFNDVLFYITLDPIPNFDDNSGGGSNNQPPDIEDPDDNNLPVEWLKLESNVIDNKVYLYWYIASQQNNKEFIIERSTDLIEFDEIGKVDGHGTTNQLIRYTHIDKKPILGTAYYRIKQIDFDGRFDYSEIISVHYDNEFYFALYPNPLSNNNLNIRLEGLIGEVQIKIQNMQTVVVYDESFTALGNFTKRINTKSLSNGVYFISIFNNNYKLTKRLVINR